MGIKDFFVRKMVESKMKDVPKEEQEKILNLIQKNPELFKKIAEEIQVEMGKGKDQMEASIEVMMKYKDEVEKVMKE
jgi:hypothetical protein